MRAANKSPKTFREKKWREDNSGKGEGKGTGHYHGGKHRRVERTWKEQVQRDTVFM